MIISYKDNMVGHLIKTEVLSGYEELKARLVKEGSKVGWILPMNFVYKHDSKKDMLVRTELTVKQAQRNAHAWAESYFNRKNKTCALT